MIDFKVVKAYEQFGLNEAFDSMIRNGETSLLFFYDGELHDVEVLHTHRPDDEEHNDVFLVFRIGDVVYGVEGWGHSHSWAYSWNEPYEVEPKEVTVTEWQRKQ